MKAADLRIETPDQLAEQLANLKKEQFNLRFQRASGQLENSARVRVVRRDIARIKTIMTETPEQRAALGATAEKKTVKPARRGLLGRVTKSVSATAIATAPKPVQSTSQTTTGAKKPAAGKSIKSAAKTAKKGQE